MSYLSILFTASYLTTMRFIAYALIPALVLLVALSLATVLSYVIVHFFSDAVLLRQLISRLTQGLLVLSIFPFMAYLKINKQDLGYASTKMFFKQIGQGFGIGFLVLIPVFLVLTGIKVLLIDQSQHWSISFFGKTLAINLLLALLIAIVEESLFRGLLWTSLSRKLSALSAVLISASYYAGLHFLTVKTDLPVSELNLWSGFSLWPEAFANVVNPEHYSALLALFAVGIFLGVLRTQYKASLGLCIGCHCCWVWQIKTSKKFFDTDFSAPYHDWVSSYDGVIGPLVSVWLAVIIVTYFGYRYLSQKTAN